MEKNVFSNAVNAFERIYRCRLCCHDYTGKLDAALLPAFHLNPFCTAVKARSKYNDKDCMLFDQTSVQMNLMKIRSAFFKKCPAGFIECVFPLLMEGKLSGAMFAGPFSDRLPPDCGLLVSETVFPGNERYPVPPEPPGDLEGFLAFGNALAYMLTSLSREKREYPENMKDLIEDFLNRRYMENIGLDDVAEMLSLTPARASNRIRKIFGKGFCILMKEHRLQAACRFLENTGFSVEEIAVRSGFRDASYFHRIFHREMKMTPQEYRQTHRRYSV